MNPVVDRQSVGVGVPLTIDPGKQSSPGGTLTPFSFMEPTMVPALPPTSYPPPEDSEDTSASEPSTPIRPDLLKGYPVPSGYESALPIWGYKVVNVFAHDPEAFTQGLVVAGARDEFIEGTGLWGRSSLRRVDMETGKVTQLSPLSDEYFGEGLTLFENRIYQLTWRSGTGFIYDGETFKFEGQFYYPHEGWGITHDGEQLIVSDGTSTIHFWDPQTLVETKQIQVTDAEGPVANLNELEYVDGEILANIWLTDYIARISPETGKILGWIDLTGLREFGIDGHAANVLNGIAYDAQTGRLFVTGKLWPSVFEIELIAEPHYQRQ
ncbi:MAG: glutaminyl-peptide cyclotransferase [Candidatus Promineifilaceae bacterium]|nr:glutaminyl-peptide cyclotransferase [Candidatus Promineifilaceae bacterium]